MYGSILLVLSANDAVLWWRMIYFPILVAVWQVLVQVGDGSGQVRSGQVKGYGGGGDASSRGTEHHS